MARIRLKNGKFAKRGAEEETEPVETPAAVGAPRPRTCRGEAQRQMTESIEAIVKALVKKAKTGSPAHTRALMELTGWTKPKAAAKGKPRRGKTLARALLDTLGEE